MGRQPVARPGQFPVRLNVANRLVYSPHDYAISVYHQTWFDDPTSRPTCRRSGTSYWGYLSKQNIAPIMLGEFGTTLADPQDRVWLSDLMAYTRHRRQRHVVHLLVVEPELG